MSSYHVIGLWLGPCKLPGLAWLDSPFDAAQGRLGDLSPREPLVLPAAAYCVSSFFIRGAAAFGFAFIPELLAFGQG